MPSSIVNASPTPPPPSSLTTLIQHSSKTDDDPLTTQILHNLQHQHLWTSLHIHQLDNTLLLISGIPPSRIYTHPDEQLYLLEKGLTDLVVAERFFVLPTAQGQSWSLRRIARVFDALPDNNDEEGKDPRLAEYYARRDEARITQEWGGKRLLLAMVDKAMGGDGTVVYYIVQEGAVKPRQN